MAREYIKEYNTNKILGMIDTEANGDQTGRIYPSYTIVGYYKAKENVTMNYIRQIVSKGNSLQALVLKEAAKGK